MKTQKQAKGTVSTLDQLQSQLKNSQKLNLSQMKSICGGEGEDNGGGDIIIIPKPKTPPTTTENTSTSQTY